MKVIPPLTIDDVIFLAASSTGSEPAADEIAYNSVSNYPLGAVVISATAHRKYESLQANNSGHALPVLPETENDWWLDVGPTNRWAMFDLFRNTTTLQVSPLQVFLEPGKRINSVALLGIDADEYRVLVYDGPGGSIIYNTDYVDLSTRVVVDWYAYFFDEFSFKNSVILTDLPPNVNAILQIEFLRTDGYCSCAGVAIGSYVDLGKTQYNAESDVLNFSTVERDIFGNSNLVQRRSLPKTVQTVIAPKSYLENIRAIRTMLNAVPAVWFGIDDTDHEFFEALLICGYYRKFSISLARPEQVISTLELEEI